MTGRGDAGMISCGCCSTSLLVQLLYSLSPTAPFLGGDELGAQNVYTGLVLSTSQD